MASLTVKTGKYKDIEIEVLMGFYEKRSLWAERLRAVKEWLHSQGQGRLKFADDPGYYYKVRYVKATECERQLGKFGSFAATFVCEPYVYLEAGEIAIPAGALVNEYTVAHPIYHISGEGQCTLTVNKNAMVCNVGQNLTIDTDRLAAYREDGIDEKREELFEEYLDAKYSDFRMKSLEDYDRLKKVNMARRKTQSRYVRNNLMDNAREHSNGESAFLYFSEKIKEDGLYLLDEPENSLSPERQQELVRFIEDSARFFGCQFVIATHSPFLLAVRNARIYDMDEEPVDVKRWTQLPNVRAYYDFFKKHKEEFE